MSGESSETLADLFRREHGAVLASLVRICGDLHAAEDALQEACAAAAIRWPRDGTPPNPGGWLMTTARRKLVDDWRRTNVGKTKQERAFELDETAAPGSVAEDRLSLLFACCHPSLSLESRVILTLRTICGLTTEEIAAAFLVPTATMAQRIVRAKNKIKVAKLGFEVPEPELWNERLSSVMAAIYLAFNQGYELSADRRGIDLAERGIEIARLLDMLVPEEPEVEGLLALMLLTHSRVLARIDDEGMAVLLEDQDRSRWDTSLMEEAFQLIAAGARHGSVGQYWLQAAIAAEHVRPTRLADRNWEQIVALYDKLLDQTRQSPVVALNRALAVAKLDGPQVALAQLDALADRLDSYSSFHAARANLLDQAEQAAPAARAYERAIARSESDPQRLGLQRALDKLKEL